MKWRYLHCSEDALGSVVPITSSSCSSDLAAHPTSAPASPGKREGTKLPAPHKTLEILTVSHSNRGLNALILDCLAGISQLLVERVWGFQSLVELLVERHGVSTVMLTVVKFVPPLSFPFSTDTFCCYYAHHRSAAGV